MVKKLLSLLICIGLVMSFFTGCSSKTTIYVYNVGDYIDEEVIKLFQKEYPEINVNYETFYTNEEMHAKVKAGRTNYDVVFPSDYMVERMIDEDMLLKINFDNIPNYKNIAKEFRGLSYDPNAEYSVPYMWGTMGILYNKDMVDEKDMDSWKAMYDKKYSGEIFMLDSERDMISITLKSLGYSMNSDKDSELKEAENALIKQKTLVKAYCGDEVKDKMIANEGAMTIAWSGDAFYCMEYNDSLRYSIPKEGSNLWFDSMVIPKTSKHQKEAELFIDFMCRPEIAKMNAEYIGYSTANEEGRKLLDKDVRENPLRYPDITKLKNMEIFKYDALLTKKHTDLWSRVKVD
jgi:spermidine/putrescine transport system substrate-binding protein